MTRLAGLVRLAHPFPSLLDGLVCAIFALAAGGTPTVAVRLGLAMLLLQAGIGTVNDIVDAPRDAGLKVGKPIPAGLVSVGLARLVALAAFGGGLLLAAPSGPPTLVLAVVVIVIGLFYDLRLKGTAWSWLPFAAGIPLLPVFGWLGAASQLPPAFVALVPAAVAAGAALAIANSLADVERDRAAGVSSVAVSLGPGRAWLVHAVLLVAVVAVAAVSVPWLDGSAMGAGLVLLAGCAPLGAAVAARASAAGRRERAWEAEAVGVAILAVAWIAAVIV